MSETYGIADLAREFGITTRAIRFYEDWGLLTPSRRGQRRVYSESDRRRLRTILRGRRLGFSLEEIAETLALHYTAPEDLADPVHALARIARHRARLAAIRADATIALEWLDHLEARCRRGVVRPEAGIRQDTAA